MADISGNQSAARSHCDAYRRENADLGIRRPAHTLAATPLDVLAAGRTFGIPASHRLGSVIVRRSFVTLTTRRASFDVWAALASLEELLSDYRRIAPRYSFMQTAGEASVAAGNEYRFSLTDPALLGPLNTAIGDLTPNQPDLSPIAERVMDVRVVHAGPWGGETGELVVEALRNHALAGASSLWVLAHDDADDGNLRVTLDAFELARWAWAPDFMANQQFPGSASGACIIDWDYLFERLIQKLDGKPETAEPGTSFSLTDHPTVITRDGKVRNALKIHNGLKPFFDSMSSV